MDAEIKTKLLAYFSGDKELPGNTDEEKLPCFYLDSGVIDSLGIIELVMFMEETFGIQFTAEDMQSAEFRTVGGLIALIEALKKRPG